jgi:subtilisin-like proprotein convertase family protein
MVSIGHQLQTLSKSAPQYAALAAQYQRLSASLGGDDPAHQYNSAPSGSYNVAPPTPPGGSTSTFNFSNNTAVAIPDLTTVSSNIVVSGVTGYLYDVDLTTLITHTFAADLDITLTAPSGKIVTITTDNGGGNDNVFNGTLFDDSSPNDVINYTYTNLVVATPLTVEGALGRLIGENANGTWTLTVTDDAAIDVGSLNGWKLDFTTLNAAPTGVLTSFSSSPNAPILDLTTINDNIVASGMGTFLLSAKLTTNITHTYNSDLDISLTAPNGTILDLSLGFGGSNDNVFAGTKWFDAASDSVTPLKDAPVSDYVFVNLVTAPELQAEEDFNQLIGSDPNGTWTLTISDTANIDTGTLVSWSLDLTTTGGSGGAYCTAKVTSNGCTPTINGTGTPSATSGSGFVIAATNVINNKNGLLFYGTTGPASTAFQGGTLCVKSPIRRTGAINSGGNPPPNDCSGVFSIDMNAFAVSAGPPVPLAALTVPGTVVNTQFWGRDPGYIAPNNTQLTDGWQYTVGP